MDRRTFLQSASLAGISLAAGSLASGPSTITRGADADKKSYDYKIAFGAWINDMRSDPVPLTDWPAHQFDDCTVDSAIAVMDLMAQCGCKYLDAFGLWATRAYPLDVVSAFQDSARKTLLDRLFTAADQRGVRLFLPLGLMTWGYDEIIAKDPAVRRQDGVANPCPSAMCGAQEKSWSYIEKIIDAAMQQYPFAGIHMESADQGYCMCPACSGADGAVGYNSRLNARCADYVRSKYPGTITMTIPINWLPGGMTAVGVTPKFTPEEMNHVLELSKHIDIFMDQGHSWTFTPADRIAELHCAYGTSGGRWLYHSARYDRLAFFVPNPREVVQNIQKHHALGVRACLMYQGPVVNPGVEINALAGFMALSDVERSWEDILGEIIATKYRPRTPAAGQKLRELVLAIEDGFYGQWENADQRFFDIWKIPPRCEWKLNDALFGTSPDPAMYLMEPYLTPEGRQQYKAALVKSLATLDDIRHAFDDDGRIERMRRCLIVSCHVLNTVIAAKGEKGWN
jgi:hypothetical protein